MRLDEMDKDIRNYRSLVPDLETEIANLRSLNETIKSENISYHSQNNEYKKRLTTLHSQNDKLADCVQDQERQLISQKALLTQIDDLTNTNKKLIAKNQDFEENIAKYKNELL
jgi:cell division protein FtsB